MKTVSTKVDESVYQKLTESCGKSGTCVSERLRKLIEESLESKIDEFKPHHDKYGNYFTYDKDKQKWVCHINMKNI